MTLTVILFTLFSTEYEISHVTNLFVSYDKTSGETLLSWVSYYFITYLCLNICVFVLLLVLLHYLKYYNGLFYPGS